MIAWLAAAVAVGLWLLLLLAFAVATRNPHIEPSPATSELAEQSPAVVDLITGGWRLCDEAPSATLLDLAARGALAIEEIGPELSLVRLRRDPGDLKSGDLKPYEKLVYDHVRSLAVDGVVATGALAEGARDLGRWWKSFRKKVIVDARAQGLSQPRWNKAQAGLLTAAATVPAAAIGIALTITDEDHEGGFGAAVVAFGLLLLLMGKLNGERGTRSGAEVAGHWLGVREHLGATGRFAEQPAASVTIWGRHLAYAAALGLAPRAVRSLPVSTPADDRRAWSDYGGMWHAVHITYPSRRGWGREPRSALKRSLVRGLTVGFWVWIGLIPGVAFELYPFTLALVGAVAAIAAVAGLPIAYAIADLKNQATVEGQIVRLRRFQTGGDSENPKWAYWCAIDEGRSREIKAFGIGEDLWSPLAEGDVVRAAVGRKMGWISRIEVVEPSRQRDAVRYDDTAEHLIDAPERLGDVEVFPRRSRSGGDSGGGGHSRSGTGIPEPADLITPADLKRALGIDVGPPVAFDGELPAWSWLTIRSCSYRAANGVRVDVHTATGKFARNFMTVGHVMTRVQGLPVQGIGSGAMLYPGLVFAQTDRGTVAIGVSSPTGPPPPDPLIDLARTAAARLAES